MSYKFQYSPLGSFGYKLGYASEKSLLFITAGAALARIKYKFIFYDSLGVNYTESYYNQIRAGLTAGIGYERQLYDNWFLRADLQYTNYKINQLIFPQYSGTTDEDYFLNKFDLEIYEFLVGVVYHF